MRRSVAQMCHANAVDSAFFLCYCCYCCTTNAIIKQMHCIATRNSNDVPSRIALTDVRINDAWIIIEYDDAVVCS